MTSVAEFLDASTDERPKPEIVNGRYRLPDPEVPAKRKLFSRVTTVAKALDDEYGLGVWEKRMVAQGIAARPDLALAVLAATDDKELDKSAELAKECAGGNVGSRHGKAFHAISERVDRGEKVKLPSSFRADLDAYLKAMSCFETDTIERLVMLSDIGVAGTLDRLVRVLGHPEWGLCVLDIKTGDVERKWTSILVQITLYARAKLWFDLESQSYKPMPEVNQDIGFVMHVPRGEGTATLYQLDLTLGDEIIFQCLEVRRLRTLKGIAKAVEPESLSPGEPSAPESPAPVVDASPAASDRGGDTRPLTLVTEEPPTSGVPRWPLNPPPDDGVRATRMDIAQLRALVTGLLPEQRQRISDWERSAVQAQRAFGSTHDMTRRMFACSRAALAVVLHVEGWQERLALSKVLGTTIPDDWEIGACIGSLTITQADELSRLALTCRQTGTLDPF